MTTEDQSVPPTPAYFMAFDDAGNALGIGYTPDGTLPPGVLECTEAEAANWQGSTRSADGLSIVPPSPAAGLERLKVALLGKVDAHLNAAAQAKGYDSITTAALRAALPESRFHAEGVAFGTWMDEVYAFCYDLFDQVQAGEADVPTADELLEMLPTLQLPD